MPDVHAKLGPSKAHQWINCPGSIKLEEQFPDTVSEYAEAGRLAHELAELKVRKWGIEPMGPRTYNSKVKKLKESPYWDNGMEANTEAYLEYIKEYSNNLSAKPFIAVERQVSFGDYVPEGFGSSDCIIIGDETLHVIDYKNGAGVPVAAEENPQMKLYALGAYLENAMFFTITKVKMTIFQPNVRQEPDSWECSVEHLLEWADSIKEQARKAYEGVEEFKAGDHCRFCRAKAKCRTKAQFELAAEGFVGMDPLMLSDQEIGDILARTRTLSAYVKTIEEYALKQLLQGEAIPGWKAVEGRTTRKFTDLDAAFNKAKELGFKEELLFEKKPITLAQLEKAMGKKEFEENLSEFVDRSPGAPTLAPEDDKRAAITVGASAKEDFK